MRERQGPAQDVELGMVSRPASVAHVNHRDPPDSNATNSEHSHDQPDERARTANPGLQIQPRDNRGNSKNGKVEQNFDHMKQAIFLCFKTKRDSIPAYAIEVPCYLPTKTSRLKRKETKEAHKVMYKGSSEWNPRDETDSEVLKRIRRFAYRDQGWWKHWVPFFGITGVVEIQFTFIDRPKIQGRYIIDVTDSIYLSSVDEYTMLARKKIVTEKNEMAEKLEQADQKIRVRYSEFGDGMEDIEDFAEWMDKKQEEFDSYRDALKKLHKRLSGFSRQHLLRDCIRDPSKTAQYEGLFDGLTQGSSVHLIQDHNAELDMKIYRENPTSRTRPPSKCEERGDAIKRPENIDEDEVVETLTGFYIEFGWQTDRMLGTLPIYIPSTVIAISLVWLCTLIYQSRTGDTATAFNFGALICGCISLFFGVLHR